MATCVQARPAPLRCPTPREVLGAILALLPRGRAWQTTEGGPFAGSVPAFDASFDDGGFQRQSRPGSVLMQFWQAIAEVVTYINSRFCDLRLEFWCATHKETHDLWMAEYGLPDSCDPFPDLCTKVAALGGTRCDYYAAIAARSGWSITCNEQIEECGGVVGLDDVGCIMPGRDRLAVLEIIVDLGNSTAYAAPETGLPLAGCFTVGDALGCGPDLTGLACIMSRIVHAEIEISYRTLDDE